MPSSLPRIGAHVGRDEPVGAPGSVRAQAAARGADVVQVFLGDPQSWKGPVLPADPDELRSAGVDVYVHAPYPMNLASTNNRIRIPSRKLLAAHAEAAAAAGARGLVVHGGHVEAGHDPSEGVENWRKAFERAELPLTVLIENTAGGERAMARHLDALARLWDAVGGYDVGFCLDTCHAHAGGEALLGLVDRVLAVTGRIDLVHANDSRDPFDSGRDRHANLGDGEAGLDLLVEVVRRAGAPVVVETPGGAEGQAADVALLKERLGVPAGVG